MGSVVRAVRRGRAIAGMFLAGALVAAGLMATPPAMADRTVPAVGPTFQEVGDDTIEFNGYVYFSANDDVHGRELWRTDGTAAGTTMVADLRPGSATTHSEPRNFTIAGGRLFLNATTDASPSSLFAIDAAGTLQTFTYSCSCASNGLPANGHILGQASGRLLLGGWIGASDTLASIAPAASVATFVSTYAGAATADFHWGGLEAFSEMGGHAYYAGYVTSDGYRAELWRTDGVTATRVKDINPGDVASAPNYFTTVGSRVLFRATTAANGTELWSSDGTEAGTVLVRDHRPGTPAPDYGTEYAEHAGAYYYHVDDYQTGRELWRTDGTPAGTSVVKDMNPGTGGTPLLNLTSVGSWLAFTSGNTLYRTDGTSAGTVPVKTFGSAGYGPGLLAAVGNQVYLRAGSLWGNAAWRSDGSSAGTFVVTRGGFDGAPVTGEPLVGTIGVLGSNVVFSSRFHFPAGAPYDLADRRMYFIDRGQPDPVRTASPGPSISGTPVTGNSLTLASGSWILAPQQLTYQWFLNGQPIAGQTGTSLYLSEGRLGQVHAEVTSTGPSAPDLTVATSQVTVTAPGVGPNPPGGTTMLNLKNKPKIIGKAKVGKTLKATAPTFSQSGVKVRYQWYAGSKKIKKATKTKLKVTRKLKGKRLWVKATGTKSGFTAVVVSSKKTKKVTG